MSDKHAWITNFQVDLAQAFFALPDSTGFYLAGGAALIAAGIVDRETEDLDIFTAIANIPTAVDAFAAECQRHGWRLRVDPERHFDTYTRVFVASSGMADDDAIKIEFARDAAPLNAIRTTFLGPTLDLEDSAGQKMLALFGRAAPRDFVDVFALSTRYSTSQLLEFAAERDAGFDRTVFVEMIAMLDKITDRQLGVPPEQATRIRDFFAIWCGELHNIGASHDSHHFA